VIIKESYEFAKVNNNDLTKVRTGKDAREVFNEEEQALQMEAYREFGLPTDKAEKRRRDTGQSRQRSDEAVTNANSKFVSIVQQATQIGVNEAYPLMFIADEKTRAAIEKQREIMRAEATLAYLEQRKQTGERLPDTEDLERLIKIRDPTVEDYRDAVKDRLPRVRMAPERRLNPDQLRLLQDDTVLEKEQMRELEAQVMGVADLVHEMDETMSKERPKKRQKTLEVETEEQEVEQVEE